MPRGVFPRKKKSVTIATTGVAPETVKPQIRNLSGFSSAEELKEALPQSTALPQGEVIPPEGQKRKYTRKSSEPALSPEDPMNDPKYKEAVQRFTGFGTPKYVKKTFHLASVGMQNPAIALDQDENEDIDAFFYIVSKRTNLDPTRSGWMLALLGIFLAVELVMSRVLMYYQESLTVKLFEFFGIDLGEKERKEAAKKAQEEVLEEINQ